jgi:hypothetical protein
MVRSIETETLFDDDKQFVGLFLKADFASEHESGLKGIYRTLHMNEEAVGIQRYTIGTPNTTQLILGKDEGLYFCGGGFFVQDDVEHLDKHRALHPTYINEDADGYPELTSAWTEDIFCVFARTPEKQALLEELYHAAQKQDLALWYGGSGGFLSRGGLVIAIASRVPEEFKEQMIAIQQHSKKAD